MAGNGEWTIGSQWMENNFATHGTNTRYPSDGAGAVTATAASSALLGSGRVLVDGIMYTSGAAGSIDIRNQADSATLHTIVIGAATATSTYVPIGGPNGLEVRGPIAARWQGAPVSGTFYLSYRNAAAR